MVFRCSRLRFHSSCLHAFSLSVGFLCAFHFVLRHSPQPAGINTVEQYFTQTLQTCLIFIPARDNGGSRRLMTSSHLPCRGTLAFFFSHTCPSFIAPVGDSRRIVAIHFRGVVEFAWPTRVASQTFGLASTGN